MANFLFDDFPSTMPVSLFAPATFTGQLTDGTDSVAFTYTIQSGAFAASLSGSRLGLVFRGSELQVSTNMLQISSTPSGAPVFTTLTTTRPVAAPAIGTLVLASGQFLSNLSNMGWVVTGSFVTPDLTVSVRTQSGAFTQLSTPSVPYNGLVSGLRFSWTNNPQGGGFLVLRVSSNGLVCFHEGTQIETENGPVAIETLTPGTRLRTSDGALTTLKWLGCQQVDAILTHPAKTYPVRISAGALGNGLPQQDLLVSAEHALEIDGYLINAGALINGTTITQDLRKRADSYTYYHIDTGTHELILAEGIASETYIDYAAREAFDNADKAKATTIAEMPLPRISSARLVPAHIRNRLAPRIAAE